MGKKLKLILFLGLFVTLNCYGQSNYEYWALEQSTPDWALKIFKDSNLSDSLELSSFVNPFYFEEDFNGDSFIDIAILVRHIDTNKYGILIIHGETQNYYLLGANSQFELIDDFSWIEIWKVFRGSLSYELTYKSNNDIEGTRKITVHNPCLEIIKLEASSGLIYWNGERYRWVQLTE